LVNATKKTRKVERTERLEVKVKKSEVGKKAFGSLWRGNAVLNASASCQ
jgi:hypothetical protein